MQYRQLGKTDLKVSTIAVGLWAIAGDQTWGNQEEADSIAAIETALDLGINFFDTAEAYGGGYSEEVLGKALHGRRDKAIIATKVGTGNIRQMNIRQSCEASLKRLSTDYIDLYQLHWPVHDVAFDDKMAVMEQLRDEGKIRVIGVSNYGPQDTQEMLKHGRFESNQYPYSLLWRGWEYEVQPLMVEHQISILPYSPLQQGLLTGKFTTADDVPEGRARTLHFSGERPQARHEQPGYEAQTFAAIDRIRAISEREAIPMEQLALAWLLAQPMVTSVLAGARNPEQVRSNAATADLNLADALIAELSAATDDLKQAMGGHLDPWSIESRAR